MKSQQVGPPPSSSTPHSDCASLRKELADLRARLQEAEDTLTAIRTGEVDALVVGNQVYTLESAEAASNRFRGDVLSQVNEAVIAVNLEGRVIYINPAAERQYGVVAGTIVGCCVSEVFQERWIWPGEAERALSLRESGRWRGELIHLGRNGEANEVEVTASFLRDSHDATIGELLVIRDITERKRAEAALRESERQLRFMAESMPQKIFTAGPAGEIDYVNRQWMEFTGRTFDEIKGSGWQQLIHPDDLTENLAQWRRALETGETLQTENRIRRSDGAYRWHLSRARAMRDAAGNIIMWIGSNTDIDDIKRIEADLTEAKNVAEAASRAKDQFLAVLSHELRTPLTPVLLSATSLEGDQELPLAIRKEMAMIRRNVELETKLIDDLLDLNRITAGKLALHLEPVSANELVRQVCEICRSDALDKAIRIECEIDDRVGLLQADAARLQQALWNIVKNAIKFTPSGGLVRIGTSQYDDGRAVRVTVRDNGIGIPPQALPRIFEAFHQGNASITGRFGGLGLGLAISKAIVELHLGTITAASGGEGKGSAFTVQLPIGAAHPHAKPAHSPAPNGAQPHSLRLLIVEDHPDTCRALARILRRHSYIVETASGVAEALSTAAKNPFDIIISDLGLPGMSGYDLMKQLREIRPIPGIAMSGYGMEEDVRKSREAGFSEHLVKPVRISQLQQAIQRIAASQGDSSD